LAAIDIESQQKILAGDLQVKTKAYKRGLLRQAVLVAMVL